MQQYRFVIVLLLASLLLLGNGVQAWQGTDTIQDWKEGYYPAYPLDPSREWTGNLSLEAGYPLVNHTFGPITKAEWSLLGMNSTQEIRYIPYDNPPLFPNTTAYIMHHDGLEGIPVLTELKNSLTGDDMLAQIGSAQRGDYDLSLTPLENDQAGNIGWYVVNGTFYPHTWVTGHLSSGQTWAEYWGPYDPDKNGSILRKRTYVVSDETVYFGGRPYAGYLLRITGPHVIANVTVDTQEERTIADQIGTVKRVVTLTAREPFIRDTSVTGKQRMPAGTMIFRSVFVLDPIDTRVT